MAPKIEWVSPGERLSVVILLQPVVPGASFAASFFLTFLIYLFSQCFQFGFWLQWLVCFALEYITCGAFAFFLSSNGVAIFDILRDSESPQHTRRVDQGGKTRTNEQQYNLPHRLLDHTTLLHQNHQNYHHHRTHPYQTHRRPSGSLHQLHSAQ
jgi:hypothetical protein